MVAVGGIMRSREKLTLEEKVSLALDLIKRERTLEQIRTHYRVSHTTAYKVRNAFLEGGKAALTGDRRARRSQDLEDRVRALENLLNNRQPLRGGRPARSVAPPDDNGHQVARKRG